MRRKGQKNLTIYLDLPCRYIITACFFHFTLQSFIDWTSIRSIPIAKLDWRIPCHFPDWRILSLITLCRTATEDGRQEKVRSFTSPTMTASSSTSSYLDGSFVCINGEQSKCRRKKLEIKNNQCSGSSPLTGASIDLPSPPGIKARVSHERDRNISTAIRSTLAAPDRTDRPLWAARGSCPATPTRTRGTSSTKARQSSSHSTKWPGRRAWKLSRCAWQSFRSCLIMF